MSNLVFRKFHQKGAAGFRGIFIPGISYREAIGIILTMPDGQPAYARIVPVPKCSGCWFLVGPLQEAVATILAESLVAFEAMSKDETEGKTQLYNGRWQIKHPEKVARKDWDRWVQAIQRATPTMLKRKNQ
ncbi:hypothetical protein CO019_01020 [Candidatus Berkelbacteria bacterium CG_4_9_14_0_2_um_filter_42_30]|uniref:Uncharacterized protein n=1 Tax=Candidatus Berkelbacteria bacterium CG_4_9_14_0_2_um_filter_42_30 TaxID=1974506 RepID=A0A2M8G2B7_9BACT|nr:MAG: hypothetical protein CO019_01020 [Candidatus Berkelbacteria bacterium CG_4_9_14_0_2_um_filter_42_30]